MAQRRMFSINVIESDDFLELSYEAQLLYIHLCMYADDDGFLKSQKKVCRLLGITDNYFSELIDNGFVISFENGVCCIVHWHISNQIRSDRYKPTIYKNEFSSVILSSSGIYEKCSHNTKTAPKPAAQKKEPYVDVDLNQIGRKKRENSDQEE